MQLRTDSSSVWDSDSLTSVLAVEYCSGPLVASGEFDSPLTKAISPLLPPGCVWTKLPSHWLGTPGELWALDLNCSESLRFQYQPSAPSSLRTPCFLLLSLESILLIIHICFLYVLARTHTFSVHLCEALI